MKFTKKILFVLLLVSTSIFLVFAEDPATFNTDNISTGLDDFTFSLIKTAPSTVSHQNMWASAYIGQLLDLPPHLGGGISFGMAQLKTEGLATVFKEMGLTYDVKNLFLPTLTFDARIGGLFIPFDIGVHGMMIKNPLEFNIQETVLYYNYCNTRCSFAKRM